MNTVLSIKEFIDKKPNIQLGDLYFKYQLDMVSILIGAILAKLEYKEILATILKNSSEAEFADLIEVVIGHSVLFEKIIPQNVHSATILLLNTDHVNESKDIIERIKKNPDYLSQIKKEDLFGSDIVMFTLQPSVRTDGIAELIKDQVRRLDVVFSEVANKDFFIHFSLTDFLVFDQKSIDDFNRIIQENIQDAIFPAIIQKKATINDNEILVSFDNDYLELSICQLDDLGIDYEKAREDFLKSLKEDIGDELVESGVKYLINPIWGFGILDVSLKIVKNFLVSLYNNSEGLIKDQIKKDHTLFVASGETDVKAWFLKNKINEFTDLLKNTGFNEEVKISSKMFESYYSKFIQRYYVMYGRIPGITEIPENHTEIFTSVYEHQFDLNIKFDQINMYKG